MLLAFTPLGLPALAFDRPDRPDFSETSISLDRGDGTILTFSVKLALSPRQQAYGLMHVESMPQGRGMLFVFQNNAIRSFWMKNTLIPLDMVFIDNDGKLVSIQREAEPQTTTPRPSNGPARYVLEIDGGEAAILGIDENTVFEFGDPTKAYVAAVDKALGN